MDKFIELGLAILVLFVITKTVSALIIFNNLDLVKIIGG